MPRVIRKLLHYFQANAYKEISLDWLVRKSKKSRATVLRYISEVRRNCPRGWKLDCIRRDYRTFYKYRPTAESFRRQKTLFEEDAA